MIEIKFFTDRFLSVLDEKFGERVWFVGLQGSYGRGEATGASDVDFVVILDELLADDIKIYNEMLDGLPNRELICGFLSGKRELFAWEPSDLFALYYDTIPLVGSLDELLPLIDKEAVDRAIKIGACNIYHGLVHNMLYEKSEDILVELYKSAYFVVRAICLKKTGKYVSRKGELLAVALPCERGILNTFFDLREGGARDFDKMSEDLFEFCKKWI